MKPDDYTNLRIDPVGEDEPGYFIFQLPDEPGEDVTLALVYRTPLYPKSLRMDEKPVSQD